MYVVLDIDNTIVCCSNNWLNRAPDHTFRLEGLIYYIYVRPGFYSFLNFLIHNHHKVGVWTAGTRSYAICILSRILGPGWKKFLFLFHHRKHCKIWNNAYVKDLRLLTIPCVLIDDNFQHVSYKLKNYKEISDKTILLCSEFWGDHKDIEFKKIRRYFQFQIEIRQYL